MGRPHIDIDRAQLEALMRLKPSIEDCAVFFKCHPSTIVRLIRDEFGQTYAQFREQRMVFTRFALTRELISRATTGKRDVLLIFAMKNMCGWTDKVEVKDTTPIQVATADDLDKTFTEFCAAAGYPTPFDKQEEMRCFAFEDTSNTSRLLLGSRGYGKTDYVTILGTAFSIYQSRQTRVLIMTKSDTKNKAIVEEIEKALAKNGVELEKSNALELRTKGLHGKDPSVGALTIKSTGLRGRHPDLIIMDDPVTEDDVSEATRLKLEQKYSELVKLCPNIAIIGQPAHVFDLYESLRPIVRVMEVPHGTIPELDHDLAAMKAAGVSASSIEASYHLRITSETGNPFAKVNFIDEFPEGDSVAFIDPSFKGGDYTAMSIIRGYGQGIAVHGDEWKKAYDDCTESFIALVKQCNVIKLWFEINSLGMQPIKVLRAAFLDAGLGHVEIKPWESNGFKHARIMAAGTFAPMIHLTKTSGRTYVQHVTKYEHKSKFDDAPDSLASCMERVGLIKGKQ